ncbi:hypothetical protein G6L16_000795 [Agrobacterium tumefaciens]|uniref:hypothetical protein n=1 Tax=Agrobacterium tumefaciens TaxID=358 RepID=UPI001572A9DA|nr:hypothetical protein [Agrobacterium tumefaciens]NSZ61869.1 hypothetical protein [Agrobacterium tumefaciens]NTA68241.1 hypothetical protein [Agrobacterium tumefaciens]WIE38079.1 hypothetical protein G6L16_000795 [Agrobacterium tumefaciens]
MVFVARWVRNIVVGFTIYVAAVMSTGAVMAYGCISRIDETQVFDAAKRAYLNKLITTKKLADDDLRFIKCGPPQTVIDYFYGVPMGWEWSAFCAYIKDDVVIASEAFHINECRRTRLWEQGDEGFPKSVRETGYDRLL